MTLLPRSLFGRLTLLLLAVVVVALATTILLFRHDRAALLSRQFADTKIVQLQAVRAALEAADPRERRESLARIGREYRVRIVPESERPFMGGPPPGPLLQALEERLREALGPDTELRVAPGAAMLVRLTAAGSGYWVGFALPPRPQAEDVPSRALIWSLIVAAVLLVAAFLFARYLARPLRELNAAVERVGRGEMPPPLPEHGPSEIVRLNRGFNQMTANLRQLEEDRALLLAGVSHDLRTPLARLRLGVEMQARDEATRAGMVDDIAEMDRIIGQFLDFARGNMETAAERCDLDALVRSLRRPLRARRQGRALRAGGGAGAAVAAHGNRAARDQSDRQCARVRRATRRGDDRGKRGQGRAGRRRPRAGHPGRSGRTAEATVHARFTGAQRRARRSRRGAAGSRSSSGSRGCTAERSTCCRVTAAAPWRE